jgi:hypothetical protein
LWNTTWSAEMTNYYLTTSTSTTSTRPTRSNISMVTEHRSFSSLFLSCHQRIEKTSGCAVCGRKRSKSRAIFPRTCVPFRHSFSSFHRQSSSSELFAYRLPYHFQQLFPRVLDSPLVPAGSTLFFGVVATRHNGWCYTVLILRVALQRLKMLVVSSIIVCRHRHTKEWCLLPADAVDWTDACRGEVVVILGQL